MKHKQPLPTQEFLNSLFTYEPDTGIVRWKVSNVGRISVGDMAGHLKKGRMYLSWPRGGGYAAPVIWKMVHGTEPDEIDHIDRDPLNDRLSNLRASNRYDNVANTRVRRDSTTGVKGVHPVNRRFRAIRRGIGLGYFATVEEAKAAYDAAENRGLRIVTGECQDGQ